MRLSRRTLNRTLWVRQQLVPQRRTVTDPIAMIAHLVGLQAQDRLPPYLSLAARIADFDPASLSAAIEQRRVVRVLAMRGTVHVLTPDDALALRTWVQPTLDQVSMSNQLSRPAAEVASAELCDAVKAVLAAGPLPVAELGERLHERFPDVPVAALRNAARERVALVQVPPRGLWQRSGGVVYELLTTWLARPPAEPDPAEFVRRYLRAFGPATATDMTTWSRVTRLGPVFASMRDELVVHENEAGRPLYDVPDGAVEDEDLELPAVVLGVYDNLWLSHADRSRIADKDRLQRWAGPNGGTGSTVFVDGRLEGCWRGGTLDLFRRLTRTERADVDDAISRARAMVDADAER